MRCFRSTSQTLSEPVRRRLALARPPRRTALAVAILLDGREHREIAALAGISAHALWMIVRGLTVARARLRASASLRSSTSARPGSSPMLAEDDEIEVTR